MGAAPEEEGGREGGAEEGVEEGGAQGLGRAAVLGREPGAGAAVPLLVLVLALSVAPL